MEIDDMIFELHGYSLFLELVRILADSGKTSFSLSDILQNQDTVIQNVLERYKTV